MRIALFDTYVLALREMERRVQEIPEAELAGAFTEEEELLNCLQTQPVDMVIADMMLKSSQNLILIDKIRKHRPEAKIILFVDSLNDIGIRRALQLGVSAFLQKDTSAEELKSSITSVARGNIIVPGSALPVQQDAILTEMEEKVLTLIADEYTNEKIAKTLFISKRTVETYVASICRKLGVEGRVGSVREGLRLQLVK
jgi:two-component system vancomycin resistance associated response regulator VraR